MLLAIASYRATRTHTSMTATNAYTFMRHDHWSLWKFKKRVHSHYYLPSSLTHTRTDENGRLSTGLTDNVHLCGSWLDWMDLCKGIGFRRGVSVCARPPVHSIILSSSVSLLLVVFVNFILEYDEVSPLDVRI